MTDLHVLIEGGGIGGLTAALCLARQGFDVEVFEQDDTFREAGAGLQISPNGMRVLDHLGLVEEIAAVAFFPEAVEIRDWRSGGMISAVDLGEELTRRYGHPYCHVHRADLLDVLVTAARRHDRIDLHPGRGLQGFSRQADRVVIDTERGTAAGDVLVGADGIHSVVREGLFGADAPVFTGNIAWRALVPAKVLPDGMVRPVAAAWWGPGRHFVHYYVRRGELVNCVCVVEKAGWEVESWMERGDHAELKQAFAGWHASIETLIDHIEPDSCFRWALHDRPPMSRWSRDRTTLLGDACHPTLPFLAQGAVMAIEDAAALAGALARADRIDDAFRCYEELRRKRTAMVQEGSRRNATVFHLRGWQARARNLAANRASHSITDKLYRYDVFSELDKVTGNHTGG